MNNFSLVATDSELRVGRIFAYIFLVAPLRKSGVTYLLSMASVCLYVCMFVCMYVCGQLKYNFNF